MAMDSFGFTRKKFSALAPPNRHRHLIRWLTGVFQSLSTNRVSPSGFNLFLYQYENALAWLSLPLPQAPDNRDTRACMEFVSDAIHFHRREAGILAKDADLLSPVTNRDRETPPEKHPGRNLVVALDGLRSLFNVGSIFRTCDAAGVSRIILGNTPGKEEARVQKTAMGAQEWVEQEKTTDLFQALTHIKAKGFHIIGVETMEESRPCHAVDWPQSCALVFGNEEYGISRHVLPACDAFVHIPMFGRKNSMNVASAVAVVLYQALLSGPDREPS